MERNLSEYMFRWAQESKQHPVVGLPTDGAMVPGLKIQNTLVVLPNGIVHMAKPMVSN